MCEPFIMLMLKFRFISSRMVVSNKPTDVAECACEAQKLLRQRLCGQASAPSIMGYDQEKR